MLFLRRACVRPNPTIAEKIIILGSTGSIGVNALKVVTQLGSRAQVVGLSAYGNMERLLEQIHAYHPEVVGVGEQKDAERLRGLGVKVRGRPLIVLDGLEGLP